jgi:hypothetical protein
VIPTHVYVTANPGKTVPIARSDASAPGAELLKCTEGNVYRLPWNTNTRRRINAGDLSLCDRDGKTFAGGLDADGKPVGAATDLLAAAAPDLEAHGMESNELGAVVRKAKDAPAIKDGPAVKAFDTSDTKGKG